MKILYLTPGCFDKGGISRYSRYQIEALREIVGKENVKVLSLLGPRPDDFEQAFSVDWHSHGNSPIDQAKFTWKSLTTVLTWRPVLILTAHVNLSGLAIVLAKLVNAKTILNIYGLEVWSGLSYDANYGLRKNHYIISDCHFTADYVIEKGFRSGKNISVIWDCVDLVKFQAKPEFWERVKTNYKLPDRDKFFIILTLGRLSFAAAHKGYDRLIQVFRELSLKKENARLVIAGKGDMANTLKDLVDQNGLNGKVCFTGMVAEEDMAALYSYAHVFSLVSDRGQNRGEGIPLTPLEAMACEVPIIVGNHDGSQEAVFEDQNGKVINPFDLTSHKDFFIQLMSNSEQQKKMALRAKEIAHRHFDYQFFVEKHRTLLSQVRDETRE